MRFLKDSRASPASSTCSSTTSSSESFVVSAPRHADAVEQTTVHLSAATEVAVRMLPGNDRCADCKTVCPQWAGVSFGILLCLACAGKHRSLGVQTSFVKSLLMDSWSPVEQRALEVGGNAKWLAVCAGTGSTDLALADKYASGVAKAYKSRILRAAGATEDTIEKAAFTASSFLSMLANLSSPSSTDSDVDIKGTAAHAAGKKAEITPMPTDPTDQPLDEVDGTRVKCTTCRSLVPMDQLDSHSKSCTVGSSRAGEWRKYERTLGAPGAPLGFSLTKTNGGFAEVSRIIPGGEAERANVLVGSYLVGLDDVKNSRFDDIVELLKTRTRPMQFHFVFRPNMAPVTPVSNISSVPEPVTVEINITLQEKEELGCSLSVTDFSCVVSSVDEDCLARRHGVLVGSRVVAVNGRGFLKPKELIHEICTAKRPITLKVHRVDGLMRGWNR